MKKIVFCTTLFAIPIALLILYAGYRVAADAFLTDPALERKYDELIAYHAAKNNLEPEFLKAVIWRESRFRSWERGSKGEIGLMQLLPPAANDWARIHRHAVPSKGELRLPEINVEIGAWYLAWCGKLLPQVTGDREALQLAIYNAGYKNVKEWISTGEKPGDFTLENVRFPSTRRYITAIKLRRDFYVEENAVHKPADTPAQTQ